MAQRIPPTTAATWRGMAEYAGAIPPYGELASIHRVVDDLAIDHGQHRLDALDPLVGDFRGVEHIVGQHREIAELALRDRAELVVLFQEPAIGRGVEPHRFRPGDLLAGIDRRA